MDNSFTSLIELWLIGPLSHASLQNLQGERLTYLDPVVLQSVKAEDLIPLEVDDEFIFEHEVVFPPNAPPSLASGFILHSRIFWASIRSLDSNTTEHEPCPCLRVKDFDAQITYYQTRLHDLKHLLEDVPSIFQSWEHTDEASTTGELDDPDAVRYSQFSSMRVNIHVTHLWLQSLVMDLLEAAQSHCQASFDIRSLWADREALSRRLLLIIFNSPPPALEANGLHLANKVRDIAASLLSCPLHPDDPISKQVADYVRQSTDILSRLDSSEGINIMHLPTWVDTDRIPANAGGR
jgi:hypothetical protein